MECLQQVGGQPLIARAIHTAKAAKGIGRIVVSTDRAEIAAVAASEGAEVVQSATEPETDRVSVEAVLLDALEVLRKRSCFPDVLALLWCTAPLTTADDIEGVLDLLDREQADCAFAAVPVRQMLWAPNATRLGECALLEAGSVYAVRVPGFVESKSLQFGKIAIHAIDPARWLVVETPSDLYRARQLAGEMSISLADHPVIYVDIDETICIGPPDRDYRKAVPIPENIAAVNRLYDRGHTIVYWTARGGKSGKDYTQLTAEQLDRWGARYHRLVVGKPSYDLLICDKATSRIPWVP